MTQNNEAPFLQKWPKEALLPQCVSPSYALTSVTSALCGYWLAVKNPCVGFDMGHTETSQLLCLTINGTGTAACLLVQTALMLMIQRCEMWLILCCELMCVNYGLYLTSFHYQIYFCFLMNTFLLFHVYSVPRLEAESFLVWSLV